MKVLALPVAVLVLGESTVFYRINGGTVRELDRRYPKTWRYDYYCPDVGRAKTTIGGRGYENPNTELLRYGKMD